MERPSPRRSESEFDHLDQHLHRLERKLDAIMRRLNVVILLEEMEMAAIDTLEASVTAETTVIESAVTLLNGLSQALKDAIATGDPARVQAVVDRIDADKTRLSDAVAANTPAAP